MPVSITPGDADRLHQAWDIQIQGGVNNGTISVVKPFVPELEDNHGPNISFSHETKELRPPGWRQDMVREMMKDPEAVRKFVKDSGLTTGDLMNAAREQDSHSNGLNSISKQADTHGKSTLREFQSEPSQKIAP